MHEKIGPTLVDLGYDVHIYGSPASRDFSKHPDIHYHPHDTIQRLSLQRLRLAIFLLRKVIKLKHEQIVFNSIDLLIVIPLYQIIFGASFSYDVRENSYRNTKFQSKFPFVIRTPLAYFLRVLEWVNKPFIEGYFLAEQCYQKQLPYLKNKRHIILENKAMISKQYSLLKQKKDYLQFCITGTLSPEYETITCIQSFLEFHKIEPSAKLIIAGYSPLQSYQEAIQAICKGNNSIELIGIDRFVDHEKVLEVIAASSIGFCYNANNKSFEGKIPTKIFEYIALNTITLYDPNRSYQELLKKYSAGIPYDVHKRNVSALAEKLKKAQSTEVDLTAVTWGEQERDLLKQYFER